MKQFILIVIFAAFAKICISTIIVVQQPPNQGNQEPPPPGVPVPEIRYFPKHDNGNSSDPNNNGTVKHQPQPTHPQQPSHPNSPFQPQHPFGGGMMPPNYDQSGQGKPQIRWMPLGRVLFGRKR